MRFPTNPRANLLVAVIAIELVDLVFAIDSVPAVLAISHHPFVVYTSNICAILGLRALYFLLAGLLDRLRFLHFALAAILGFVGCKMLFAKWINVPVAVSLGFIVTVVLVRNGCFTDLTPHQPNLRTAVRWTKPCARSPSRPSPGHTPFPSEAAFWTLYRSASRRSQATPASSFVLTSPEIWALWGQRLQASLAPREPIVLFLPPGERHKRMSQVERLTTDMAKAGADRSSLLLAFGGGVTGDVGGFVSAIYMRGIDYIQIPTTLLSQVDSSVGGKTGVNLQTGKNLVGCFYPPQAVVADIELLRTLPQRELRAGIYESIKAGLIRDAALFRFIESHREAIDQGDPASLEKMVAASIRIKADVVSEDEKELGVRMILNFGHTLGHAIEAASGYHALLHGEAIAWGMIAALHISRRRNLVAAGAGRPYRGPDSLLSASAPTPGQLQAPVADSLRRQKEPGRRAPLCFAAGHRQCRRSRGCDRRRGASRHRVHSPGAREQSVTRGRAWSSTGGHRGRSDRRRCCPPDV